MDTIKEFDIKAYMKKSKRLAFGYLALIFLTFTFVTLCDVIIALSGEDHWWIRIALALLLVYRTWVLWHTTAIPLISKQIRRHYYLLPGLQEVFEKWDETLIENNPDQFTNNGWNVAFSHVLIIRLFHILTAKTK